MDFKVKETDSSAPGQTRSGKDARVDLYYGAAIQYQIEPNIAVGLDLSLVDMGIKIGTASGVHTVSNVALSITYKLQHLFIIAIN